VGSAQNSISLPASLPGFEGISRYWDRTRNLPAAKILPGEYYVSAGNELITTVLGSCVSACIRDKFGAIGGMNHFMLPISDSGRWNGAVDITDTATRYGNYAMEHMINEILKNGGRRENLEAKVFGGGRIIDGLGSVGESNVAFVQEYLRTERIPLVSQDVGDIHPRKIIYMPVTGQVWVKRIRHLHNDTLVVRERRYRADIGQTPISGEVELFD
jgi:chemotaxis protein CheD